jgi:hypothetical protein
MPFDAAGDYYEDYGDYPEWYNDEPIDWNDELDPDPSVTIDEPIDWNDALDPDPSVTTDPPIDWNDALDPDPSVTIDEPIDWNDALDPDPNGPSLPPGVPLTAIYDPESGTWVSTDDSGASTVYGENGKVVASYDETGKLITGTGVATKTGYQPGSVQTKNPDGTVTSRNINGSTTTFKPDGSILKQTPASPQGLLDYKKAKDAGDVTKFLKDVFAPDGKVSPVAPAIGAIIGMLNRRQGDEGTRGLKDAPAPLVANRQQITSPVGAATGQGQQYFSPTTFTKTAEPQNLPVRTTGGGLEGLRPQPTPTGFPLGYDPNAPKPPRQPQWEELYDIPPQDYPMDVGRRDYPPEFTPKPEGPSLVSEVGRPDYEYYKQIAQPQIGPQQEPAPSQPYAEGGLASIPMQEPVSMYAYGGLSNLGSYTHAAGGRMLKGPGDGMSDSIPASIAGKQPARLATDEFVIPADVVSHLGNGSSDAGAKVLYDMMARVRKARTGKAMQGKKINPQKLMPR